MSTNKILQINTASSKETEDLAEKLAKNLKGGEVIELMSDLGGGKTTFVRGLARGLGSSDNVSSPTFKLSNIYEVHRPKEEESWTKPKLIYHYDFYRLADAGLMGHELHDSLQDPEGVVIVEWGNVAANVLPIDRVKIKIINQGEDERQLEIDCGPKLQYLTEFDQ